MNASDIQQSEAARKEYDEWLNQPMTINVIGILRMEGRVSLPDLPTIRAESALCAAGQNEGWHKCIDRLLTLSDQPQKAAPEPTADFGAVQIMEDAGLKVPGTIKQQ